MNEHRWTKTVSSSVSAFLAAFALAAPLGAGLAAERVGGLLPRNLAGVLRIYRDGSGGLGVPTTFLTGSAPERSVTVVDADGDGHADLAVSEPRSGKVWLYLGDAAGGFENRGQLPIGPRQTVVAIGDFDGDGVDDEALSDPLAAGVTLRFGDGAGGFRPATTASGESRAGAALVADFDGDGNVDMAGVDGVGSEVSVFLGDGQGGVRSTISVPVGLVPRALAAADFNGDDVPDLAIADDEWGEVSVLLGDGSGGFEAATRLAAGPRVGSIAVGDFDGDGHTDLVVASERLDEVCVLFGDGKGGFAGRATLPVEDGGSDDATTSSGSSESEPVYDGPAVTGLTLNPTTIAGGSGGTSTATVTLGAPAPAGGTPITLASSNTELAASVLKIVVPEGATSATFTVVTNPRYRRYSGLAFSTTITAANPGNATSRSATLNVTAQPRPTDPVFSPDSDMKGLNCAGETGILFDCPLPSQGVCKFKQECTLGCLTRPIKGASWDDTCATIGQFPIVLNPTLVLGGNPTAGTLRLTTPAAGGSTASVVSNSLVARASNNIPQTITTGATSVAFDVLTAQVNAINFAFMDSHIRTIEAGSSVFTTRHARTWVTVVPASGGDQSPPIALNSLTLELASITGGLWLIGTVTIDRLAPAPEIGSVTVSITSSDPAVAAILQSSLSFIQGSNKASFAIQTSAVAADTTVTITVTLPAGPLTVAGTQTATLTVRATPSATGVRSFFLDPLTVVGGNPVTGTVVLDGLAPSGGAVVALENGNAGVVSMPASVTVPAGTDRTSFGIGTSPVAANTNVSLTARFGNKFAPTTLTVVPAGPSLTLSSLTLNPTSVVGGNSSTGTVALSGAVPAGSSAVVTLSSSNPALASVPANATVPAGATSASFTVTTASVTGSTSVTISANFGGTTRTATLTLTPPSTGPLPAPSLVSPANDARFPPGQTITFDWTDVTGAASYTIQIDDSDAFALPLIASQTVTASQTTIGGLPTLRMWWRVRANDVAGAPGTWSAARRFELKN